MVDAAGLNPVALHRGVWVRIPPSVPHPPISWLSGILSLPKGEVEGWSAVLKRGVVGTFPWFLKGAVPDN